MLTSPRTAVPDLGFYYHYKHRPDGTINNYAYEVVGVGFHTEHNARQGEEHFVVYRPIYRAPVNAASEKLGVPCFDVRPLEMWMETVRKEGDGRVVPRFSKITDFTIIQKLQKIRDVMYPRSPTT